MGGEEEPKPPTAGNAVSSEPKIQAGGTAASCRQTYILPPRRYSCTARRRAGRASVLTEDGKSPFEVGEAAVARRSEAERGEPRRREVGDARDHPLTARVMVNRLEAPFGTGMRRSAETSARPAVRDAPALLDGCGAELRTHPKPPPQGRGG